MMEKEPPPPEATLIRVKTAAITRAKIKAGAVSNRLFCQFIPVKLLFLYGSKSHNSSLF
jgi:hypothetical protein